MAIHYNPTTVSDGLVLALDAANTRSYVGSGTTWTDVSYNGNNGTLTNGPAYTTVGFTEPFGGAGGVYFDGTGDYLTVANDADFQFGTGDFSLECFVNTTDGTASLFGLEIGSGSYGLVFSANSLYWQNSTRVSNLFGVSATSILDGSWHHVALTRSNGTARMFFDGVQVGSAADTTNYNGTSLFNIGYQHNETGYYTGYISNLRIIKGTALYTSNFTPPRSLLPAVSGTSLLTCQKGSIRDASSNNFAITVNGDARPVYGFPSIKFDGTNDYASVSHNPSWDIGSTPKTIECWIYFNSVVDGRLIMGQINQWWLSVGWTPGGVTSGKFGISFLDTSSWRSFSSSTSVSSNEWYNVVATWDGTFIRLFLNGNLETTSSNLSAVVWASSSNSTLDIGSYSGASTTYAINGRVSNSRIYNKALTAAEIQQNFNALRGRFGI